MPERFVNCDCLSKKCGEQRAGRQLVSRSTWFRHKAADLLARTHPEEDHEDMEIHTDPLYVPTGSIDEELLASLESAGLFNELPEEVIPLTMCIFIYFMLKKV
jgi:hypothetical protein